MHFLPFVLLSASLASASVLLSYNASAGDPASDFGLQNLAGWDDADWPSGQGQNASAYFTTEKDPNGVPAAHVHKSPHFARSEYHSLDGNIEANTTYYIAYEVMFSDVDYQTIVFQWKEYGAVTKTDDIPACLVFRSDAEDSNNHTITLGAQPDINTGSGATVWSKQIEMGTTYRFGMVIDTTKSDTEGYIQLYFDGELQSLTYSGKTTEKLAGNFYADEANPKFGLYGGKNYLVCDSYVYNVVIATTLDDIKEVAGIN